MTATPAELEIVLAILAHRVPEREVWAFGSRVTGTVKKFSDLDLAILGESAVPLATLGALADDFSESDLPYKVDLVDWATTAEYFREVIRADHVVLRPAVKSSTW